MLICLCSGKGLQILSYDANKMEIKIEVVIKIVTTSLTVPKQKMLMMRVTG